MATTSDTLNVLSIAFHKGDWTVDVNLSVVLILAIAVLFAVPFIYKWWPSRGSYSFDGAEFGIGPGKVKFKSNYSNLQIAYRMWVELSTRKVGLLVDPKTDVIAEVYDSWYAFFGVMRDLLKEIPAQTLRRDESARNLVIMAGNILNNELRPHLTIWQAKYRRWYDAALLENGNASLSPQEVQVKFGEFTKLVEDMAKVNGLLIAYRHSLEAIVLQGRKHRLWRETSESVLAKLKPDRRSKGPASS